jgi:hypothetical protein
MASALSGLISASIFRSHIISRDTSEATIYSASHIDSAIISYLLDSQAISALAPKNKYPLIDLQIDVSPTQSESV